MRADRALDSAVRVRSSVPKPEGSEASARAMGGTGGEEDQDGGEGDEEEEEELTVSSGDETHLSKHERRYGVL